jgi:hypothetical protein
MLVMQCGYYHPDKCLCPARRRKWWDFTRLLLGPHPLCIFDEIDMWWETGQSHQLFQQAPMICRHLIPIKEQPI